MAATNKYMAQSNKPRHVIRATKDPNGHWIVGAAEKPCAPDRPTLKKATPMSMIPQNNDESYRSNKQCSVCGTSDPNLIRVCLLHSVLPACLHGKIVRQEHERKKQCSPISLKAA